MRVWQSHRALSSVPTDASIPLVSPLELNRLLQLCSNSRSLDQGKQVHQQIITHGLHQDPFMTTKLVQTYADCNEIAAAHHLFDKIPQRNVFAWTAFISFHSRSGMSHECLNAYIDMKRDGVLPDKYVFPKVIRACAEPYLLKVGIQIHKEAISYGWESNVHVCNSLINMSSKCGDILSARRVFDIMVERDLLSWNTMISGYVHNGFLALAVEFLRSMGSEGFEPDIVTWNTVMDAYCRMGQCDEAWKIFGQIKEPNVISWTTLISGYSRSGKHDVTLGIFRDMMRRGDVFSDSDCLSSVLVSCRYLGELMCGRQVHAYGIKTETRLAFYKSAGPALLTMYARCRRSQDGRNVFSLMDKSDVVTWNAMIYGFADLGMGRLALQYFKEMQIVGIQNDQTTLSTMLPICDLKSGKQIHAYIRKGGFSPAIPVWNALINMYSRCGCIQSAHSVFSNLESRDIVSWNTIIGGYGMHGYGRAALELLQEMSHSSLCPNSLTFTSVLSACSHSGLVDEGLELFHRMTTDFGFNPGMEHYACVVDLLSRAGRLEDAIGFIKRMPIEPDKSIWGAVLAASRAHQDIGIGMLASEKLVYLEPENAGNYVTWSNLCARAGRWDDAIRARKLMESRKLVKLSGYSWIGSAS